MTLRCLLAVAVCCASFGVRAQELFGLGGGLEGDHHGEHTFTWEIDYQQRLGEFLAFSGGWINQGHLTGHHRDGATAQVWARTDTFNRQLTLAAGIGPFVYFDTVPASNPDGSHDDHGVGIVASLAATWNLDGPWSIQLRANRIASAHSIDSTSVLLGVAYRLGDGGAATQESFAADRPLGEREVAVLLGTTIVNTLRSEDSIAAQFEYRQKLGPYFAWSVGALYEGDAETQRRSGVLAQLWIGRELVDPRVTAAIGIGPYVVLNIKSNLFESSRERLAGIFSATAAYAPIPRWNIRFTWSRVFAEHTHDTDVLLVGAGYRF